ncbi:hypothetical protein M011DRAFT_490033 [Sporormia fimetaria CBS 119925]|uniref:Uncharacterized protein n=1 Tax=Sporormia fimetaria CBS 119925 TaxID=1340428 RepID=A0A6A6V001_9PLEO|nr:hypothetical protein M011DRAFT_490033 [Sporormia fimetaria CBS 119925]
MKLTTLALYLGATCLAVAHPQFIEDPVTSSSARPGVPSGGPIIRPTLPPLPTSRAPLPTRSIRPPGPSVPPRPSSSRRPVPTASGRPSFTTVTVRPSPTRGGPPRPTETPGEDDDDEEGGWPWPGDDDEDDEGGWPWPGEDDEDEGGWPWDLEAQQ